MKAEVMYDRALSNCARPYTSSGDHSFFDLLLTVHSLLTLGYDVVLRDIVFCSMSETPSFTSSMILQICEKQQQ